MIAPYHRKPIVKTRSYLEAEARRARDFAAALAANGAPDAHVRRIERWAEKLERDLEDTHGK